MPATDINEQLIKYLEDVQSTVENAISQLKAGSSVDDASLAAAFR